MYHYYIIYFFLTLVASSLCYQLRLYVQHARLAQLNIENNRAQLFRHIGMNFCG